MEREIARKVYVNGRFGTQHASLSFKEMCGRGYWVVSAWDRWAHNSLAEAKAHYRRIGSQVSA